MHAHALISTVTDTVSIAVMVPLAMSAFALRGGRLMYMWLFLALSQLSWLLYDVWEAVRHELIASPYSESISQMIQVAAILFVFIATVAQRKAVAK